ncbi:MAG TPA: 5'/3'-nucleotidase SurE [Vicinamibacterales bacterium]|jgi:5'-nucleotidase|nr:5'/3'-nucleotidase SurE [Vicinamibacterales bacterium]HXR44524.1 5'/3'-nucleotidase SurE [Pseudolysinimonas sp.]
MRRLIFSALVLILAGCAARSGAAGAQQRPDPPPYRILVSNDDGVRAPGIAAVAQVLQAIGDVSIVAPAENQSGKGHSIVTSEPVYRDDLTLPNGMKAIGLTATPATTVNIAIRNILRPRPDLVVSGINRGYNLAYSGYLAGTVGAAREGAIHGVPAIAASLTDAATPSDLVAAAEEVLGVARRVKQFGLPAGTMLNVNIPRVPAGGFKGYLVTTQARAKSGDESFAETKHPGSGRTIYWNVFKEGAGSAPEGTDAWAVENGYVSVTPMRLGEDDPTQMETWRSRFKQ